jgi:phage terminase small subunit
MRPTSRPRAPRPPSPRQQLPATNRARPPLSQKQLEFAAEYVVDLDAEAAAIRVNLAPAEGPSLLKSPAVRAAVQALQVQSSLRTTISADEVLKRWWLLANADARELQQLRHVACRFCHGDNHRYQLTPDQRRRLTLAHSVGVAAVAYLPPELRRPLDDFDDEPYDGTRDPHPECPECFGDGTLSIWMADTRTLSPAAAYLYNGVEVNNGKMKMVIRDRDHALGQVAKHLGMFPQAPQMNLNLNPAAMTDDQLDAAIRQFSELAGHPVPRTLEHAPQGTRPTVTEVFVDPPDPEGVRTVDEASEV